MFSGIDEPKIPSRDRVSISPGDRLGFVGCRLRFWNLRRGRELLERGRFVLRKMTRTVKGLSRKSAIRDDGRNSSRKQAAAAKQVLRSTGPVDRTCTTCTVSKSGRPDRSTDMTDCKGPNSLLESVDRPGRPVEGSVDRPGRPTVGFWVKYADPLIWVFKGCYCS